MSVALSLPKVAIDRTCTVKADQPCNVTDDNLAPDCYETMHAFKKIRTSTSGLRKSPNKWTKEENQKLAALVSSYGEKKWKRISAEMGGQKTGAQCAQHWKRVLSPEIRKGHWDENEEELLLRLVVQYGSCWKKIAKKIPQRTDIQCRYQYLKAKQSREVSWDGKEDESLLKKVMEAANCNFFQSNDNMSISSASDSSPNNSPSLFSLRGSSNYNASSIAIPSNISLISSSSSISSDMSNKENDLTSGSDSDARDDKMRTSGECARDAWNDDKNNMNMSISDDSGSPQSTGSGPLSAASSPQSSWRSNNKEPFSMSGSCLNCQRPLVNHISRIVWLEISEHMARLKLTSTLRTALECKTRFSELMGNKFTFAPSSGFSLNGSPETSGSYLDSKHSGQGEHAGMGGGYGKGATSDNIGIKINNNYNHHHHNNGKSATGNNINLTNCNNNNITINITNSYTTANTAHFQPLPAPAPFSSPLSSSPPTALKTELVNMFPKPILSPAPPFPSFSHLPSFPLPHTAGSPTLKPLRVPPAGSVGSVVNINMAVTSSVAVAGGVGGLESLAAVASILPRELLDYAQF